MRFIHDDSNVLKHIRTIEKKPNVFVALRNFERKMNQLTYLVEIGKYIVRHISCCVSTPGLYRWSASLKARHAEVQRSMNSNLFNSNGGGIWRMKGN